MAKLVVVITSHAEKWYDVAKAWEKRGAPGVTIIDSYGLFRLHQKATVELAMTTFSLSGILRQLETTSRIIFSVAPDALVDALVDAALEIVNFDEPDMGIMFVLDVERIVGLRSPSPGE